MLRCLTALAIAAPHGYLNLALSASTALNVTQPWTMIDVAVVGVGGLASSVLICFSLNDFVEFRRRIRARGTYEPRIFKPALGTWCGRQSLAAAALSTHHWPAYCQHMRACGFRWWHFGHVGRPYFNALLVISALLCGTLTLLNVHVYRKRRRI